MSELIPPGHGERVGPPSPMPRCPECGVVVDIYLAAGTGDGKGRCPTHGLVEVTYRRREEVLDDGGR